MTPPHVDSTGIIYNVRVSPRARRVGLRICPVHGLTIVVPAWFDQREIPSVIARNRDWIDKKQRLMEERRRNAPPPEPLTAPDRIALPAVGEEWTVVYEPGPPGSVVLRQQPDHRLVVAGQVSDLALCCRVVRRWLKNKAWVHLAPWLEEVSKDKNLPFGRLTIRDQRTRWGSCSSQKTISLNQKLLFIAPHLVRYIFIHELCHTVRPSHGERFWAVVRQHEPEHKRLEAEIDAAWKTLPRWTREE